jgi:hypothetical protein
MNTVANLKLQCNDSCMQPVQLRWIGPPSSARVVRKNSPILLSLGLSKIHSMEVVQIQLLAHNSTEWMCQLKKTAILPRQGENAPRMIDVRSDKGHLERQMRPGKFCCNFSFPNHITR